MTALAEVFVEARLDTRRLPGEMKAALAKARETVEVGAKLNSTQVKSQLKSLSASLRSVPDAEVDVDVDSAAASAKLKMIGRQVEQLDGKDAEIDVKVNDANMAGATHQVGMLTTALMAVGPAAIPVMAAATAAVGALGAGLGAAAGAGGIFGASVAGVVHGMTEGQEEIKKLTDRLATQEKGSEEYRETLRQLNAEQAAFNEKFGPAAKGLDAVSRGWQKFMDATQPQTTKIMGQAMQTLADVLPRLAPASNAAAKAVGVLLGEFDQWTKGPGMESLLDFFEKRGPAMIKTFGRSAGNIVRGVGSLFQAFIPTMGGMSRGFEDMTKSFADWAAGLRKTEGFKNFIEYVRTNAPTVIKMVGNVFGAVSNIVVALAPFGGVMLGMLNKIAQAINNLDPSTIRVLAGIFAAWVVTTRLATTALLAHAAAMRVVTVATKAWAVGLKAVAAAQWLVNAAMRANPIGLAVTAITALGAALVLAYKKSDTFREIVDRTWAAVKRSISASWSAIKVVFSAIRDFLTKTLPDAFKRFVGFWTGMFSDLKKRTADGWRTIKAAFTTAFQVLRTAITNAVRTFVGFWADLFSDLRKRTSDGWRLIRASFTTAFTVLRRAVEDFIDRVRTFWTNLFTRIKDITRTSWDTVKRTFSSAFDAVKRAVTNVSSDVRRIWGNMLDTVRKTANDVLDRVRSNITSILDKIERAFYWATQGIKKTWGWIKEYAAQPIRFVVNTVYNNGIRKVINAIPGIPGTLGELRANFAQGGYTGPGGKYEPAGLVHRDEHVWTKEEMAHFPGGHKAMEQLRAEFRQSPKITRSDHAGMPGYWLGGGVKPMPSADRGFGEPTHGRNYYGAWYATDMNRGSGNTDLGDRVVAWKSGRAYRKNAGSSSYGQYIDVNHASGSSRYAHLLSYAIANGASVRAGQQIGRVGHSGGYPGMTAHLHFEARGGQAAPSPGGGSGGGGDSGFMSFIDNPLKFLKLDEWKDKLGGMGGWGPLIRDSVGSIVPQVIDWAKDKLSSFYGSITGWAKDKLGIGSGSSGSPSGGSMNANNLVPIMQQAMNFARQRWGSQGLNTIYGYANRNIAGTNIKSDHAYGKALDFMTYSNMGLGDQIARYFRGPGRRRFNVENVIWRAPMHYDHVHIDTFDKGGLARGVGRLPKNDIRPERVLDNRQTVAFEKWMAGDHRGSNVPTVHIENMHTRDDRAAARELAREQMKAYTLARFA